MGVIVTILVLFIGCALTYTLASYALAWYEYAGSRPGAFDQRFAHPGTVLSLLALETLATCANLLVYPIGWFTLRTSSIEESENVPVLLVHGLFLNSGCWLLTERRLRQRGFGEIHLINLPPWEDIERLTERLAERIEELHHNLGIERLDLVGHSLGGLVIRNYLQRPGSLPLVRRCVFLGTPHSGSRLAIFALSPVARDLMPGSDFLLRLNAEPLPQDVPMVAIQSCHDNIVLPWENSRLHGARNVELTQMGHNGLLYHPAACDALVAALKGDNVDNAGDRLAPQR
jgi:pimeloyl-ACP methyl ester carboxylesterase